MKKAAEIALRRPSATVSHRLEIDGLGALGIGLDVERHLLALVQRAQARRFHGRDVDEHVLVAAVRRDEAKTLGGIKNFTVPVAIVYAFA